MNFKKIFRIIFRNKTYSLLNIAGLAVGITAAALIFLWVESKVNFNKTIPGSENIYVAGHHVVNQAGEYNTYIISTHLLSDVFNDEYPEVVHNTRYFTENLIFVPENTTHSFEEKGAYADTTLFSMINMTLMNGDVSSVFNSAYPILLSQSMARKLYGTENPVGKGLLNEGRMYEVTGVFKDLPGNITFEFEWLIPFRVFAEDTKNIFHIDTWGTNWMMLYAQLEPHADIDQLNRKLKTLVMEKAGPDYEGTQIFLYPINRTLLYGDFKDGMETGGGYNKTVRLFFLIGILILVIACINFMNLSTARSQKRALEVGVHKTFGTKRKYLIRQFLLEAGIITAISLMLSLVLIWLSLPLFNDLIDAQLSIYFTNPLIPGGLLAIGLFCTLLAGSYPALYLSSFNPIITLKMQKTSKGGQAAWVRQGLVVFQFTMAFILICTTFVIYLQIQLAQGRDIGLEKENIVTFPVTKELTSSWSAVRNDLLNTGMVEGCGFTFEPLLRLGGMANPWYWNGKESNDDKAIVYNYTSPGLIDAAGIKLVDGTDFNESRTDSKGIREVMINETLARRMGEEGRVGGRLGQSPERNMEIVGIMKDFVYNDPYMTEPGSVIFFNRPERATYLFVRLRPDADTFEAIGRIQSTLKAFIPNHAFEATLMTERFDRMFEEDKLVEKLSTLFAILAIFISCLGLFGLSSFSAEQRTKEIGVRKVLGANITDILILLGKTYVALLFISFVIGIPISLYITNRYLKDYAYRIEPGWDIFATVALFITLVALLTVSTLSLKAAIANPVKSMKTE